MKRLALLILSLTAVLFADPLLDLIEGDSMEIHLGFENAFVYKKSFYLPVLPVDPIVERTGCDPLLLKAVMRAESDFRIHARSWANAMGVAQFIPLTADWLGLNNPYDPVNSTFKLCEYLRYLSSKFDTIREVLWAYHDGETRVRRTGPTNAGKKYADRVLKYYEEYKRYDKKEFFQDRVLLMIGVGYSYPDDLKLKTGIALSAIGVIDGVATLEIGTDGITGSLDAYLRLSYGFAPSVGISGDGIGIGASYFSGGVSLEITVLPKPNLLIMYDGFVGLSLGDDVYLLLRVGL